MSTREQLRVIGQFFVGALLGALFWAFFELLFMRPGPFYAISFYAFSFYWIAVPISVFISMLIFPKSWPVAAFAVYVGQVIYILCFNVDLASIYRDVWLRVVVACISVAEGGLIPTVLGCCLGWFVEGLFARKRKTI